MSRYINVWLAGWADNRRGFITGAKKDGLRLCFEALAQRCTVSSARVRRGMGGGSDAAQTQFTGEQLCMPTPHTLAWLLVAASVRLKFSSLSQPADTAAGPSTPGSEADESHILACVASFLYVAAERPQLQSLQSLRHTGYPGGQPSPASRRLSTRTWPPLRPCRAVIVPHQQPVAPLCWHRPWTPRVSRRRRNTPSHRCCSPPGSASARRSARRAS